MKTLTLEATLENITKVTEFIDAELEACECSMKAQMQIDVAIDELFGNIARYAYGQDTGEATIQFDFDAVDRMASIVFMDHGVPFNPLEQDDPDVTLSAEARAVGGLGIFLVKKTMDKLTYRFENGMNVLTLYKHI